MEGSTSRIGVAKMNERGDAVRRWPVALAVLGGMALCVLSFALLLSRSH